MQEVRKSQNQDLRADPPSVEYKLRKRESRPGDFPGFSGLRAAESSSGVKGPEILFLSGVGTFHGSDSSLLLSLVDSGGMTGAFTWLSPLGIF